jgi:hypothetical protein
MGYACGLLSFADMGTRTCSICGKNFPLDRKHFRWRVRDGKETYSAECLICVAAQKKESKKRVKTREEMALQQIESTGAAMFLKAATRGGSNIPHSAEVIERVMQYFGGVAGFSSMMVKQYYDAPPGGSTRTRMLETMCRLVSKNVDQGGTKKPLNLWSEAELEQELDRRFARAVATFQGITIDAEEDQLRIAQEAEASTHPLAAGPASDRVADPVRAGEPAGDPERDPGTEGGGPAALPGEPEPGKDPRLQGE